MKNLILIGFKSAGKTTLGRHASMQLKRPLIDIDDFFQPSPREVYRALGRERFRELEKGFLQTISSVVGHLIVAGGGVVLDADNCTFLRHLGTVVHLQTPKEVIKKRVFSSELPAFLEMPRPEEHFEEIYKDRLGIYLSVAHHNIITEADLWEVIRLDPFSE